LEDSLQPRRRFFWQRIVYTYAKKVEGQLQQATGRREEAAAHANDEIAASHVSQAILQSPISAARAFIKNKDKCVYNANVVSQRFKLKSLSRYLQTSQCMFSLWAKKHHIVVTFTASLYIAHVYAGAE
jgi:hypothetical protein